MAQIDINNKAFQEFLMLNLPLGQIQSLWLLYEATLPTRSKYITDQELKAFEKIVESL